VGCGNLELEVPAEPDIVLFGACAAFSFDRRQLTIFYFSKHHALIIERKKSKTMAFPFIKLSHSFFAHIPAISPQN